MFVREEFRNRGIGSALLAAIIATAEERRYARLCSRLGADRSEPPAHRSAPLGT